MTVCIPHDQGTVTEVWNEDARQARIKGPRRRRCVDDGQIYDSTVDPSHATVTEAGVLKARVRPNPFNPTTAVEYTLPVASRVTVEIYNVLGAMVRTIVDEDQTAGRHTAFWNGQDESDRPTPTGVYFYRVKAGELEESGRMLLMK